MCLSLFRTLMFYHCSSTIWMVWNWYVVLINWYKKDTSTCSLSKVWSLCGQHLTIATAVVMLLLFFLWMRTWAEISRSSKKYQVSNSSSSTHMCVCVYVCVSVVGKCVVCIVLRGHRMCLTVVVDRIKSCGAVAICSLILLVMWVTSLLVHQRASLPMQTSSFKHYFTIICTLLLIIITIIVSTQSQAL